MAVFRMRLTYLLKHANAVRSYTSCSTSQEKKGLVLGVYSIKKTNKISLTAEAEYYNEITKGKLLENIKVATGDTFEAEKSFVFWNLSKEYSSVAVVGLGDPCCGYNELEEVDDQKEAVRIATGVGCQALQSLGVTEIHLDPMHDPESVAEAASLSTWTFDKYKSNKKPQPKIKLVRGDLKDWTRGIIKGSAQNLARLLADTPSNLKPPRVFAEIAKEHLEKVKVAVQIRDRKWLEEKKMCGVLTVAKGSEEPPVFLEMNYNGAKDQPPIVLVGKGVTFDAGGYALKPSKGMDLMRGDCGGAACVVATMKAIAELKLPVNVVGLVPLCENLVNGKAAKPGDVITMMNGKTVCIDNPDAEGRLILGDALTYGLTFKPRFMMDVATLTGAIVQAIGTFTTGVFCNSFPYWEVLHRAGCKSGDRMWRFPLWKCFSKQVTEYKAYDINNIGKAGGGGACTAAAFLREFVPDDVPWAHLDIAGVAGTGVASQEKYITKGMTGRPTRTIINFVEKMSKNNCKK